MKTGLTLEKKTLFRVVSRAANAVKLSASLIVAKDRKELRKVLRERSITEFTAEIVVEVLA